METLNAKEAFELWSLVKKNKNNTQFYKFYLNDFSGDPNFERQYNKEIVSFKRDRSQFSNGFYIERDSYRKGRTFLSCSTDVFVSKNAKERDFVINKKNLIINVESFLEIKNNPYYFVFSQHQPNRYFQLEDRMLLIKRIASALSVLNDLLSLDKQALLDELNSFSNFYPTDKKQNYNELYEYHFNQLAELGLFVSKLELKEW